MVTDTQGLILNYELTPASIHDAKAAPEVIGNCPCPFVIADVGYVGKKAPAYFFANGLSTMAAIAPQQKYNCCFLCLSSS